MTTEGNPGAAEDGSRDNEVSQKSDHRTGKRKVKGLAAVPCHDLIWPDDPAGRRKLREQWMIHATRICTADVQALRLIPMIWHLCNIEKAKAWPTSETLEKLVDRGTAAVGDGLEILAKRGVVRLNVVHLKDSLGRIAGQFREIFLTLPITESRTVQELEEITRSRTVREQDDTESRTVREAESRTVHPTETCTGRDLSLEKEPLKEDPMKGSDLSEVDAYARAGARDGLERLVVGFVLRQPDAFARARPHLQPQHFTHPRLARIWQAMGKVYDHGHRPTRPQVRLRIDPADRQETTALEMFIGAIIHEHQQATAEDFEQAVEALAEDPKPKPPEPPRRRPVDASNAYALASRGG